MTIRYAPLSLVRSVAHPRLVILRMAASRLLCSRSLCSRPEAHVDTNDFAASAAL